MESEFTVGNIITEIIIFQAIDNYEKDKNFDELCDVIAVGLSPAKIKLLEIAVDELVKTRKDYHVIMSFISQLKAVIHEKYSETNEDVIKIVED